MNLQMGVLRHEENGGAVRFERRFAGTPSDLWPFLTEAEHLSAWITPGSTIDARVGGRIVFPWKSGRPMEGEITVLDPPHRMEYIWREGAVDSIVRLDLIADGKETILIVDHSGLPLSDSGGFAAGWHSHLEWLEHNRAGRGAEHDQQSRFAELAKEYGWSPPGA